MESLSGTELGDLYSKCIALAVGNRINSKNTWTLKLIDYMQDLLEDTSDKVEQSETYQDSMFNFQKASCALDAGVKIYSCRVDSIHTDAYKVLNGLNRTKRSEDDAPKQQEKAKKKQPEKKTKTLSADDVIVPVEDLKSITVTEGISFESKSLTMKILQSYEENGYEGLLLNNIPLAGGYRLQIPENALRNVELPSHEPNQAYKSLEKVGALLGKLGNAQFCPELESFVSELRSSMVESTKPESSKQRESEVEENTDDDSDLDILDFEIHLSDLDLGPTEESHLPSSSPLAGNDSIVEQVIGDNIPEVQLLSAEGEQDPFTYFKDIENEWPGPTHWKFGKKSKDETDVSFAEEVAQGEVGSEKTGRKKGTGRRKPKKRFLFDFSAIAEADEPKIELAKRITNITYSDKMIEKSMEENKATNPTPGETSLSEKDLMRLFLKPQQFISFGDDANEKEDSFTLGIANEDLNDLTDDDLQTSLIHEGHRSSMQSFLNTSIASLPEVSMNIGPEEIAIDIQEEEETDENGNISVIQTVSSLSDSFLIKQPRKPEKLKIQHTVRNRKVDIKRLKENIWKEIVVQSEAEKKSSAEEPAKLHFSTIVSGYAGHNDKKRVRNVSIPYCFISLLHLANEKNLTLSPSGDAMNDIEVTVS